MARRITLRNAGPLTAVAGAAAFAAFYCYCIFVGSREELGFQWAGLVLGGVITVVMTVPIWGVAMGAFVLALCWTNFSRPRRWIAAGACGWCGYGEASALSTCPECGRSPQRELKPRGVAEHYMLLAVVAWFVGLALGTVAGEGWLLFDEARFKDEVQRKVTAGAMVTPYGRARLWPGTGNGLMYTPERGFYGTD